MSIAPEIFQRKMNELLGGLEGVAVYMDDRIVHGKYQEQNDEHLKRSGEDRARRAQAQQREVYLQTEEALFPGTCYRRERSQA